jgi:hypothetical protein
MGCDDRSPDGRVLDVERRQVLVAVGAAATGGLAGCQEETTQSFEAAPVTLPESARDDLALEERSRESPSVERSAGGVSVRVTSQIAVYGDANEGGD